VVELYVTETKDRTVWQAGAPDLQTEAEFLTRLMRKLGLSADQASQMVAGAEGRTLASVTGPAGKAHGLTIADGFDGSWRRIGLALDRSGFTVEDRDRGKGVYFVRYAFSGADGGESGFFKKLLSFNFSDSKDPKAEKYQIVLTAEGTNTKLVVKNAKGEVDTSETAQNMVKVLANDLK
jgi:outer membrane protein assembly factor BamC